MVADKLCLDCLQKQKPWVTDDMAILSSRQSQCDECGENKQLVCIYTESDKKLLEYTMGLGVCLNQLYGVIHFDKQYCGSLSCHLDKLEITLRTLVVNLGWDIVRNKYMYIKGQEDGKPLAFKTTPEYEPYLNYKVVGLGNSIILREVQDE